MLEFNPQHLGFLKCKSYSNRQIIQKISQATDIAVVFENTAKLRENEFNQIKTFLQAVISSNTMSATSSRISLVSYGTTGKVLWDLNSPNAIDAPKALKAIAEIRQSEGELFFLKQTLKFVTKRV